MGDYMDIKDNEVIFNEYKDTDITKNTLEKIVGKEITYKYIQSCSHRLDTTYHDIYKSQGFNNFYDMYVYCDLSKEKPKAYVQKKVKRNGKDITLYKTIEDTAKKNNEVSIESYRDLKTSFTIVKEPADLDKVSNKVSTIAVKDIVGDMEGNIIAEYFDNTGQKRGATFYIITDNSVVMNGYVGDRTIKGLGVKSYKEGIIISDTEHKPLEVSKSFGDNATSFLKSMGMKEIENKLYTGA